LVENYYLCYFRELETIWLAMTFGYKSSCYMHIAPRCDDPPKFYHNICILLLK